MKKLILTFAIFTSVQIAFTQEINKQSLTALKQEKKANALLIKKLKAEQQAKKDSADFVKLTLAIQKQRETIKKLSK